MGEINEMEKILTDLIEKIENSFNQRIEHWKINIEEKEIYEVIGGLLSRQFTLAKQFASTSYLWNYHIAPILLRVMIDNYFQFAWILLDPLKRSRKFIYHGLGQEKLALEHIKKRLVEAGIDPEEDPAVKAAKNWINSQRFTFLTDVNVGHWADINTRKMASEIGEESMYHLCFLPFNLSVHNSWCHISRFNLASCENPLHGGHRIPVLNEGVFDIYNLELALKYLDSVISKFDEFTDFKSDESDLRTYLIKRLDEINVKNETEVEENEDN